MLRPEDTPSIAQPGTVGGESICADGAASPEADPPGPGRGHRRRRMRLVVAAYLIAVAGVGLATLTRYHLGSVLDTRLPFVLFVPIVLAAGWFGGWLPALTAGVLGLVVGLYLFIPPFNSVAIQDPGDALVVCVYGGVILVAAAMATWARRIKDGAMQAVAEQGRHTIRLEREISERRRAEAAQVRTAALYKNLFETAGDAIVVLEPRDLVVLEVNEKACLLYGLSRKRFLGSSLRDLSADEAKHNCFVREVMSKGAVEGFELLLRGAGGRVMPLRTTASIVEFDGRPAILSLHRKVTGMGEASDVPKAVRDQGRSGSDPDEDERIASHDIKELLRGIRNSASFVLEDNQDRLDQATVERLRTIDRLAVRLDSLVASLFCYLRVGRTDLTIRPTDLNAVVAGVVETLGDRAPGAGIRVPRPLPVVSCDPERVSEVFRHLIANGLQYNNTSDKLVEIGWREPAGSDSWPIMYVRDNGIGIADQYRGTVFRFFRRLHPRDAFGGGTGAGLAIVKRIVERHGGRIWVEPVPGGGSEFLFTLGEGSHAAEPANPDH